MRLELDGNTVAGLFCLQVLARQGRATRTGELAAAGRMTQQRTRRVLRALAAAGLAASCRDGWRLARPAGEITLGAIRDAVKGLRASGRPCRVEYEDCPHRSVCALAPVCRALHEGVEEALRGSNLAALAGDVPSGPVCSERRRTRRGRSCSFCP